MLEVVQLKGILDERDTLTFRRSQTGLVCLYVRCQTISQDLNSLETQDTRNPLFNEKLFDAPVPPSATVTCRVAQQSLLWVFIRDKTVTFENI